ncbi:hypothetical protein N5T77_10060 [Aliarcobacter cryaerophilus]|uniref:hypothetical protein n=1 Tax=Aliarcobacter cryaerophilus TaxID=28198 RepID=UPI0021B6C156|nr:hypothetical protein [Aliarcobacter cryaerophilus]MCT7525392.1 hypothetical protein [Aliarcobacter cryaerophilus]
MKTILFFSRMRLTYLYGELNSQLNKDYNCIHVVYSEMENSILKNNYCISSKYNLKKYLRENKITSEHTIIKEIDDFIITYSQNRFNLNSSIQSDRGMKTLSQKEAYELAILYYNFWKEIFEKNIIDVFFHESTSLLFNFIASLFCNKYNVVYTDLVGVPYYKKAFLFISSNNGSCIEFSNNFGKKIDNAKEIRSFLQYINNKYSSIAKFDVNRDYLKLFKVIFKNEIKIILDKLFSFIDPFYDNIEHYMLYERRSLHKFLNLLSYNFFNWDKPYQTEKYYYYSMNLEPEAVVEYLADGIYRNQVKLIENIASQLPPNHFLYVKDHVTEFGYRNYKDYLYLKKLHNVKVIHPSLPGSQLIKNSCGVIAICGTAVLEAIFLKKVAYMFGNFYYTQSNNVIHIANIKDLKQKLYLNIKFSDRDYFLFLSAYIKSLNFGEIDLFTTGTEQLILDIENIISISNAIKRLLQ